MKFFKFAATIELDGIVSIEKGLVVASSWKAAAENVSDGFGIDLFNLTLSLIEDTDDGILALNDTAYDNL